MNGKLSATKVGVVHNIIVQKCEIMVHLQSCRLIDYSKRVAVAQGGIYRHTQTGADTLAPGRHCIAYGVVETCAYFRIFYLRDRFVGKTSEIVY